MIPHLKSILTQLSKLNIRIGSINIIAQDGNPTVVIIKTGCDEFITKVFMESEDGKLELIKKDPINHN